MRGVVLHRSFRWQLFAVVGAVHGRGRVCAAGPGAKPDDRTFNPVLEALRASAGDTARGLI